MAHDLATPVLVVEVLAVVLDARPLPASTPSRPRHSGAGEPLDEKAMWRLHLAASNRVQIVIHQVGQVHTTASGVFLGAFNDLAIEVEALGNLRHWFTAYA